jgi:hypothetical protein
MAVIIQQNSHAIGTGDINLAAALLTMGIPPAMNPVKLIAHENGRDYVRFSMESKSVDGTHQTVDLMTAWSARDSYTRENPHSPMAKIMAFCAGRPNGCRAFTDWAEYAGQWLGIGADAAKVAIKDIANICAREPESEAAYILAFIRNKFDLVDVAKEVERRGHVEIYQTRGKAIALISERLPKHLKQYIQDQL